MDNNSFIVPLYHRVKESIFFSFEECIEARTTFLLVPSEPNKRNFQGRILNFYNRIRPKLVIAIATKKLKKFDDIKMKMDNIRTLNGLDLELCFNMCFRFSDFLDAIGITQIDFKKADESSLYDYT